MPRYDLDRNAYVGRMDRRVRWAWRVARLRHRLRLEPGSIQAEAYERAFDSDRCAVTYHYATRNDHMPDFERPTWVNEKIRWQFLNHDNPLMRIAADKVAVRDYLAWKGTAIRAPRLHAAGLSARDLLEADLPDRFVLKSGSGWGQNLFVDGPERLDRAALAARAEDWLAWDHWRLLGELHYRGIPKRWLAEEIVGPPAAIVEYKFYCVMGEPLFFLYLTDRAPGRFRCGLFDMAWRPTPFHWARHPPTAERPRPPAAFEAMAADARRLSEDFLHVRVDFLLHGDRPYFSELTFSGGGARNPFVPRLQNEALGEMLDLGRAGEYAARGRAIASALSPMPAAA
jgi:hypothetical protein